MRIGGSSRKHHMKEIPIPQVINAAGKLTALGGSAQSDTVASALADAARTHLDLAAYRAAAGARIAELTGAEAACVTSGAAAGVAISVAALLTGTDPPGPGCARSGRRQRYRAAGWPRSRFWRGDRADDPPWGRQPRDRGKRQFRLRRAARRRSPRPASGAICTSSRTTVCRRT